MTSGPRGHRSWVTSHTECPDCHYEFNFRHSKWGSVSTVRLGPNWIFICPNCKTKQSFLLKKGEVEGLPLIMDQSFTPFLIGALAGTATFALVLGVLIFVTSGNPRSGLLIYGFAIDLTSYVAYMIWLGLINRSSGRSYIVSQAQR